MQAEPSRPLVTCVIIFLNGEDFLAEAIESVIAQSYPNWELVLVDDGSTDGATAIAKNFAAAHPGRITYSQHDGHENRGMSASRNAGIKLAKGDYVAFLDADDIWLPERLSRHIGMLESHPEAAMLIGPTLLWSSWDKENVQSFRPWLTADVLAETGLPAEQLLAAPDVARTYLLSHGAGMPGICSLTIRREKLLAVGGFEDEFRTLYEDQVMLFKMFLNYTVIAVDDLLDYYRQHPNSACGQLGRVSGDQIARPVFLEWLQRYMIENNFTDPDLWRALRGEFAKFDNPKAYRLSNIPNGIVDTWNEESRRAVIWLLTPKRYRKLKRMFGSSDVNFQASRPTVAHDADAVK